MANTKLLKVMDYLINEQEDKARELLHQIFIEKARAIHEEMMSHDEDMEEDMMGGDHGDKLAHEIESDLNEIDAEEHYGTSTMEAEDDDMEVSDAEEDLSDELEDMGDMDDMEDVEDADDMPEMGDEEVEDTEMTQVDMEEPHMGDEDDGEKIHDLEQAIAELKAEFEALKGEVEGDDTSAEDHEDKMAEAWESDWTKNTNDLSEGDDDDLDDDSDPYDMGYKAASLHHKSKNSNPFEGKDDDKAEEWEDGWKQGAEEEGLLENIDLETVHAAKGGEVGSGRYAPAETNKHSPVPSSQRDTMGARPVKTGQGNKASGYDRQSAPDSKSMGLSNRRRDAEDGKRPVSKEGDASALLNKGTSAGYGAVNTRSPISGRK